jgi:hypothetical protein
MEYLNSKIEILQSVSSIADSLINIDKLVSMVINITTRVLDAKASSLLMGNRKELRIEISLKI